jgi:hypothetical protein
MSHTPAPWKLSVNSGWKTNPYSVVVQGRGVHTSTIANIPARQTIRPQEQEANARLISAAPDLLNALLKFPQHHGATDQEWWDWIGIARNAIDKAQGEV